MTQEQIVLSSLAMDLKRVALGYHKGSEKTAARFVKEALKRIGEAGPAKPYMKKILDKLPQTLSQEDKEKLAEDALTYSVIIQNYVLHS